MTYQIEKRLRKIKNVDEYVMINNVIYAHGDHKLEYVGELRTEYHKTKNLGKMVFAVVDLEEKTK